MCPQHMAFSKGRLPAVLWLVVAGDIRNTLNPGCKSGEGIPTDPVSERGQELLCREELEDECSPESGAEKHSIQITSVINKSTSGP